MCRKTKKLKILTKKIAKINVICQLNKKIENYLNNKNIKY